MDRFFLRLPPPLQGVLPTKEVAKANHPSGTATTTSWSNAVEVQFKLEVQQGQGKRSWSVLKKLPTWRLWPEVKEVGGEERIMEESCHLEEREGKREEGPRRNWVEKILLVKSIWGRWRNDENGVGVVEREKEVEGGEGGGGGEAVRKEAEEGDMCVGCCDLEEEGEEEVVFDQRSFSRLLRKVSLEEASLYSRLSYLGLLAYYVPNIKCGNQLGSRGLRFVTSSLERRSAPADVISEEQLNFGEEEVELDGGSKKNRVSISAAYEMAASAASYLQSRTKNILSLGDPEGELDMDLGHLASMVQNMDDILSCNDPSFVATSNSVTAVVAAEEEAKDAVANDLNSSGSSPCEWFICDDESSGTRYCVIQGSESLASWQANLFFEPIQFEGLEFVVHRGIYEAAKGIYEQMLPEIKHHLKKSNGKSATLQFTGHSLGGSLSLLVNLMLLIRGEAPASSLLPVVTFGAPAVLCGGNYLLRKLGLSQNHVQAVMIHRDIVPRAFSCNYPDQVAEILRALNKNLRKHRRLSNKKLLYEPMGRLLILQPDEKSSPRHHLLPSGRGFYTLTEPTNDSGGLVQAAQSFFLNSPHPLEILRDRAAYGNNGTVAKNHEIRAYVRSVQAVIEVEVKRIRRITSETLPQVWVALMFVEGAARLNRQQPTSDVPGEVSSELVKFERMAVAVVVVMLPGKLLHHPGGGGTS